LVSRSRGGRQIVENSSMGNTLAQCIRSRWFSAACLVVVILSVVLPPGGFGIPLCQFRATTHLPCFACGLTRSFIRMAHLNFSGAAFFHPLGLVLFPLALALALLLPLPQQARESCARWAEKHGLVLNVVGGAVLVVFLVYGLARMAWVIQSGQPSPW
jgi:hypothetical protein